MFTVDTAEFVAAIKRVIPHTAKPNLGVPVLEAVRLTIVGDSLVLSATDRYTMIECRVRLRDDATACHHPFDALILAGALKSLIPMIKARNVTEVVPGEGATVFDGVRLEHRDGDFPAVGHIWPAALHPINAESLGLGVEHVKKLGALRVSARDRDPILFYGSDEVTDPEAGGRKPVVVLYGEDTRVLVMPVSRVGSSAVDNWSAWDAVPAPAAYREAVESRESAA